VHQNAFAAGILPRPRWGGYSAPKTPSLELVEGRRKEEKKGEDRGGKKKDGGRWEKERRAQ